MGWNIHEIWDFGLESLAENFAESKAGFACVAITARQSLFANLSPRIAYTLWVRLAEQFAPAGSFKPVALQQCPKSLHLRDEPRFAAKKCELTPRCADAIAYGVNGCLVDFGLTDGEFVDLKEAIGAGIANDSRYVPSNDVFFVAKRIGLDSMLIFTKSIPSEELGEAAKWNQWLFARTH
jgi:hypothetical protein